MKVLGDGFVELIDSMGSDQAIVDAARVSYSDPSKHRSNARGLIRHLMRKWHTSPFEMAEMKFHVQCPIFIQRQWRTHRTGSFNEVSGRYSELDMGYWMPTEWRGQSHTNKQGSEGVVLHDGNRWDGIGEDEGYFVPIEHLAELEYKDRIESGVSRELARTCLPLSTWTRFVWKTDLHNLLHFLRLRLDPDAQEEIRVYAEAIAQVVRDKFPITWEAFEDYRLNSLTLSRGDIHALRTLILSSGAPDEAEMQRHLSEGEWREFCEKAKRLGAL